MQISEEILEKIKSQNDIVDVISERVRLRKAGRNFTGLCPFHNEKTPSFSVSQEKQIYKCFGCGEAGNVISFVMKDKNLPFIEAVKYLSKSHTGALIVFQNDLSNTYHDVGTRLNADVSTELLLTIFHENTPLHDGAVVISGNKIISASVLLPLTDDPKLSWKYGTRHRAAIGMTESSNAACLVVSEETGEVSVTLDGSLKKYDDIPTLKNDLESILGYKNIEQPEKKSIFNLEKLITINKDRK